jgi:type VI secretion system protein ImpA
MAVTSIVTDDPCGPDLYACGDAAFMNFIVKAEGLLPASFFSKATNAAFDRSSVDFAAEFATATLLEKRTQDIRLFVMLAKFHALNRSIAQTVEQIERLADVIDTNWETVHPRSENGDFGYRMACIQALDDNAHVVLPLQHAALAVHPRAGPISVRTFLIANGDIEPRDGETTLSQADLSRAAGELSLPTLIEARDHFTRLGAATGKIRNTWLQRAGFDEAVRFDVIDAFAAKARDLLAAIVAQRDPQPGSNEAPRSAGPADGRGDGATSFASPSFASPMPALNTFDQAHAALSSAADYFACNEPSNPALLLIRQAEQLVGKSFLEVLRLLVPDHVANANISIGRDQCFKFPVERLEEFGTVPARDAHASNLNGAVTLTRQDAIRLLTQVHAFYTANEPSSPIPYFTERAKSLAGRDFLGILKDVLPEDALTSFNRSNAS